MLYGILRGGFIMEEKILNFILECAEVQKLVPFSLIEEEFNLILDEAGSSTLARNKNYYKPQKCGLFYVKFYLFLCCTGLYFLFICDIMRYETQL